MDTLTTHAHRGLVKKWVVFSSYAGADNGAMDKEKYQIARALDVLESLGTRNCSASRNRVPTSKKCMVMHSGAGEETPTGSRSHLGSGMIFSCAKTL